jgi:uncharacterized Tic20 family protein
MTSRQPGTTPSGDVGMTDDTGIAGAARRAGPGPRWLGSGPRWPVLMVPLTLLIILGLTGLRGEVTKPRWDGPLQREGVIIGLVLEVVLGVLLVITMRRRAVSADAVNAAAVNAVAVKLRGTLIFVLSAGMVAVAVTIIIGLHLRVFSRKPRLPPALAAGQPKLTPSPPALARQTPSTFHFPLAAVLYALIVVVLLAAVVLSIWWARRFRPSGENRNDGFIAEDPEDLREAVESGRSALRSIDDARAAIIACYLAMEASLAERGAARAIADTPDELLARAQATGVVHGTAAARLTALFYEARFSSHPLDRSQRDAAAQALDELAAALAAAEAEAEAEAEAKAEAEAAKAEPAGAKPGAGTGA